MQYLLLIYADESLPPAVPLEEELQAWRDVTNAMKAAGNYIGGEALQSVTTATTVRVRDGKPLTMDGPFAETKEQLGGFYVIEAADLDEATAWAARLPNATYGSVEVRPIMKIE